MSLAAFCFSIAMILVNIRENVNRDLSKDADKVMRISAGIEKNATGVYIPFTGNWLRLHVGELAFAEKKSALLSDYETFHDFFSLKWNDAFPYNYTIGGLSSSDVPCASCYWPAQPGKPEKCIDYLLICTDKIPGSSCYQQLNDSIQKYYVIEKEEFPFSLYRSKESLR